MLNELFQTVLGMSLIGAVVILLVLAARLILRGAPRVFSYALWAVALVRLLCPFTPESALSLVPSARIVEAPGVGGAAEILEVSTGIPAVDDGLNDFFAAHPYQGHVPAELPPDGPLPVIPQTGDVSDWRTVPAVLWAVGGMALLAYSAVSLIRLRRRLVGAVPLEGERDVWLADHIDTPFVLGLFRPRIYLPSALPEGEREYVLLHERVHIRRLDHVTRALAWLALCLHWFDPLVWLAFHLAGKDMETSCDEAVLRQMGRDVRADYAASLLRLSAGKKLPVGPLAFGDGDPQSRIKNVLNYKKPAFWVTIIALVAVIAAGAVLITGRPFPRAEIQPNGERFFNAVVLEDRGGSLLAEVSDGVNSGLSAGARVTVTKDVLSPGNYPAEVEAGDAVRVVFNGLVMETDPARLGTVFAVYLLDENGEAVPNRGLSYSLNEQGCVVVSGLLGDRAPVWIPPGSAASSPLGVLIDETPLSLDPFFEGSCVSLTASWTDESKTALNVDFSNFSSNMAVIAATPLGFTADLSAGTVRMHDAPPPSDFGEPHEFTDGERLTMARTLAKIIRGAEEFYAAPAPAAFSWAEVQAEYGAGGPGIKTDGFRNMTPASVIGPADAVRLAEAECTVEYDAVSVRRDDGADMWAVNFYTAGIDGGDETVYLGGDGITRLIVGGE